MYIYQAPVAVAINNLGRFGRQDLEGQGNPSDEEQASFTDTITQFY
jgi:hypothetical protein